MQKSSWGHDFVWVEGGGRKYPIQTGPADSPVRTNKGDLVKSTSIPAAHTGHGPVEAGQTPRRPRDPVVRPSPAGAPTGSPLGATLQGAMPPAPGVEPAPARGYALPGSGHPRRSKDECLCGWFSSPPIPLRPRLHASPPSLYRFAAGPRPRGGRPGWLGGWLGGQPEGAQKYIMTPRPPTHHPVD